MGGRCEFRVLPHLVHTQALCSVDEIEIEWHDAYMQYEPFLAASAKRLGLPPAANGAAAIHDLLPRIRAFFDEKQRNATALARGPWARSCMLRNISDADDETWLNDQPAWPGKRLCSFRG